MFALLLQRAALLIGADYRPRDCTRTSTSNAELQFTLTIRTRASARVTWSLFPWVQRREAQGRTEPTRRCTVKNLRTSGRTSGVQRTTRSERIGRDRGPHMSRRTS